MLTKSATHSNLYDMALICPSSEGWNQMFVVGGPDPGENAQ